MRTRCPWTKGLVERAAELRAEGKTFEAIASAFGEPFTKNAVLSKLRAARRAEGRSATAAPETENSPTDAPRSRPLTPSGSRIDPDTGRDPARYPVGSDVWDTQERGRITVNGVIWGKDTNRPEKPAQPNVGFSAQGTGFMYTSKAWRDLMAGAVLVMSAEDRIRAAGEDVPKWGGPP